MGVIPVKENCWIDTMLALTTRAMSPVQYIVSSFIHLLEDLWTRDLSSVLHRTFPTTVSSVPGLSLSEELVTLA